MKKNLYKFLAGNEYPGRGIVIGMSPDGDKAMIAYLDHGPQLQQPQPGV